MNLLIAFIVGTAVSFIASIPVGAVNMAIVTTTLNKDRKSGFFIGIGSVIAELFYCAIPLFGFGYLIEDSQYVIHGIYLVAIPVLVIIGAWTVINRNRAAVKGMRQRGKAKTGNEIFYGLSLCASNPMVFFFWSQITAALFSLELLTHDPGVMTSFLVGVPTGTMLLYSGIIAIAHKQRRRISLRARAMINLVVGLIFIGLGAYLLADYILKFHWDKATKTEQNDTATGSLLPSGDSGLQENSLFKKGQLATYNAEEARVTAV